LQEIVLQAETDEKHFNTCRTDHGSSESMEGLQPYKMVPLVNLYEASSDEDEAEQKSGERSQPGKSQRKPRIRKIKSEMVQVDLSELNLASKPKPEPRSDNEFISDAEVSSIMFRKQIYYTCFDLILSSR